MRTRKQWRKVSGLGLGLSLTYRSGPDQHMSEMRLGSWVVENSGAAKSRGLGVTPRMVAIFWMGRVFVG